MASPENSSSLAGFPVCNFLHYHFSLRLTPLNFGQQATGTTSAPKSASLTNTGTSTLTISSLTVKGQFNLSSTTCPVQVAPGASCSISVTFSPQTAVRRPGWSRLPTLASSKAPGCRAVGQGHVRADLGADRSALENFQGWLGVQRSFALLRMTVFLRRVDTNCICLI